MSEKTTNISKIETWGDLHELIEKVLNQILPNATRDDAIDAFESFANRMEQITKESDENPDKYPGILFLFGAALDYILSIFVKMKAEQVGRVLVTYDRDNLPIKDPEKLEEFISTIGLVLNMCIKCKNIIKIDQLIFIDKDSLDDNILKTEELDKSKLN